MLKLAASKFKPRNRAVKLKLFGPFIPDNVVTCTVPSFIMQF